MNKKRLNKSKKMLYQQAWIAHEGHIRPCGNANDWNDCYTLYKNRLYFWYNTRDDSTHVINTDLEPPSGQTEQP